MMAAAAAFCCSAAWAAPSATNAEGEDVTSTTLAEIRDGIEVVHRTQLSKEIGTDRLAICQAVNALAATRASHLRLFQALFPNHRGWRRV